MKAYIFFIPIFFTFLSYSQIEVITPEGKTAILKSDGTWKYKTEESVKETDNVGCSDLIETTSDKVTGKTYTGSKGKIIVASEDNKKGFGISLLKGQTSIIVSIQAVGAGNCIDDDAKMNVLFRDGTRLEMINQGKFNCDASFTLYLGGSFGFKKQLKMLCEKEIETLRVWTSKSYVERDFTTSESAKLMNSLSCISQ